MFEYIWLNNIDKHEIKNEIVLKILKNPSLIISPSPIINAEMNSTNVINIQAINKKTITWKVKFFLNNSVPQWIIEGKFGKPITQLS